MSEDETEIGSPESVAAECETVAEIGRAHV